MTVPRFLALLALTALATPPSFAAPPTAKHAHVQDQPVSVAALARSVVIPYELFTLANGLRVVVRTDRSVKTVYVQVDYAVGSTAEPVGKTGFAHLFEHLMFNGSENAPDDYSVPMRKLGATINGVTQYDRTAYSNLVPTPGLEQVLFLESDRMGYLLGAINQAELDEQRGVVQNEKRQRLDVPLGTVRDRLAQKLYPVGHPYAHGILGSMADLDRTNLSDVRDWFRAHYAPNNAVLSLTGDIDVVTARRLVEKYFGAIPSGSASIRFPAPVPTLPRRLEEIMTDRISAPHLYRALAVPGLDSPDAAALQVAAGMMTADSALSLRQQLVDRDKLFASLSIALELYDSGGLFFVHGPVATGVDPAVAGRALDAAIVAAAQAEPSAKAVERYLTQEVTSRIATLASGSNNVGPVVDGLRMGKGPNWYKTKLAELIAQTPRSVRVAAAKWFTRPPYALTVLPGVTPAAETVAVRPASDAPKADMPVAKGTRGSLPSEGAFTDLVFPKASHARLSNGVEIVYLPNADIPSTNIWIDFDAGSVADPIPAPGMQAMLVAMLDQGTATHDAEAITRLRERMGAEIGFEVDADRTTASLSVPTANLQPGLTLIADMLRNTAFTPARVAAQSAAIRAEASAERVEGGRRFNQTLARHMDAASPYALRSGPPDARALDALTSETLRAYRDAWLRPDKATIFVVSDASLAQVRAMLERSFDGWRPVGTGGIKDRPSVPRPGAPGIVLIDRPGSDQAAIAGGQAIADLSRDAMLAASVANIALAGDNGGRLSSDLRETKGWTYGVTGQFDKRALTTSYMVMAPVQQDKAGASLALIRNHLTAFLSTAPLTQAEFSGAVENRIRALSVDFAGARSQIDAIRDNRRLGLPDDFQSTLAARYRALTIEQARTAFGNAIDPAKFIWVVSGDAARVKPQLEPLGLPITVLSPVAAEQE